MEFFVGTLLPDESCVIFLTIMDKPINLNLFLLVEILSNPFLIQKDRMQSNTMSFFMIKLIAMKKNALVIFFRWKVTVDRV